MLVLGNYPRLLIVLAPPLPKRRPKVAPGENSVRQISSVKLPVIVGHKNRFIFHRRAWSNIQTTETSCGRTAEEALIIP